ncbi:MAG: hypothetical protein M3Y49_10715 [Actinomycetota bacterium]|nr:hypothetical protein [Actinomycetota bacterium]
MSETPDIGLRTLRLSVTDFGRFQRGVSRPARVVPERDRILAVVGSLQLEHPALGFRNPTSYIAKSLLEASGFRSSLRRDWDEPVLVDGLSVMVAAERPDP